MHHTAMSYSKYLITVAYCYNIALPVYMLSRWSFIALLNSTWPKLVIQLFQDQDQDFSVQISSRLVI
ncbi:hypothetical protein GIB67_037208 [Kingdonia uniflora]|uniref:Uncharacterized protein n=1 Tax=Kingdonia uniflora TaxID=39325 RepID=A0A7J7MRU9_9MAGN|nr:hypothetical protein GIB67_037208 [Kingdonia uniflora]